MKLSILSQLAVAAACLVSDAIAGPMKRGSASYLGFDYTNDKIRGVNLGGWFVLEPYMNPSMFSQFDPTPVDEYHFTGNYTAKYGQSATESYMQNHWATWITEDDFKWLNSTGINFVRIPIGYWAFEHLDGDPYVMGQEEYLVKALYWARQYGIKCWIDVHGVPGSQNGFDNSGLRDSYKFQDGDNQKVTLSVIGRIAQSYGIEVWNDVVIGIELVNEPLGTVLDMDTLKQFYADGFDYVRNGNSDTAVVIHDAFQDMNYWDGFMDLPTYWNVVLDHHHYQVFSTAELQRSIDDHISYACELGRQTQTETLWRVVGEWSAALTDCVYWLNGVGHGSRYDGNYENSPYIGSCDNINNVTLWSDEKKQDTRKYIEAQLDAYDQGSGWVFWGYKTENTVEWDFRALVEAGLFPQPLSDRQYPNQCGF